MNIIHIIEKDDLEAFQRVFKLENWRESITSIENYAGVSQYTPQITFNDCDVFKYAVHCNADKIFQYLLPLVDTDKHGDNYGWPVLSMAVKNNRYDYAEAIIEHPFFDPYPMYHINKFKHIDSYENQEQHINFLFKYLDKLDKYDFLINPQLYYFVDLVCYSEDTYQKFEELYKIKIGKPNAFLIDLFEKKLNILGEEILYNNFKPFILDKLNPQKFRQLLESVMDNKIIFSSLFKSNNAIQGLNYLLTQPDLLQKHFDSNSVIASYLPLDCIILLIDNGIDIFKRNDKDVAPVEFMLENDLNDKTTMYFANNYTQNIYDILSSTNRKSVIKQYCEEKLARKNNLKIV